MHCLSFVFVTDNFSYNICVTCMALLKSSSFFLYCNVRSPNKDDEIKKRSFSIKRIKDKRMLHFTELKKQNIN